MENLPSMNAYLRQGLSESFSLIESMQQIIMLLSAPPTQEPANPQGIPKPPSNGLQS